jgi:acetate kinase
MIAAVSSILVVNAGSTSLKLSLVAEDETVTRLDALEDVDVADVAGVAHRVVHGGSRFREPAVIDEAVRDEIFALQTLAPLHNAPALAGIATAERALPDLVHVAVFDTAFHATIPDEAAVYAVPKRWREEWGVRRYGFHGLSVAWSAERVPELLGRPPEALRLVVCHLGGGSSITAVRDGRSVDTTMGFSPLEGVPMTTRSGSIDPGVLLHVLGTRRLNRETLDHALNFESGLKGLAGGTGSMLEVEERLAGGDEKAALAVGVFTYRVAAAVAAMAAAAGGLDALVFTAGIGEGSALVRERVCAHLAFLGVGLDDKRNQAAELDCDVASAASRVRILVVRAQEEIVAARAARRLIDAGAGRATA